MKLYDGCYGVLNNGKVVGPMRDTKSGSDWPFAFDENRWRECGAYVLMLDNPLSFRSVHPTREEAEAAVRGERVTFAIHFCRGFFGWWSVWGGFLVGFLLAYLFFACTSPTEPAPHCQYQEHTFSHDSGLDTVICLDSIAYGRG